MAQAEVSTARRFLCPGCDEAQYDSRWEAEMHHDQIMKAALTHFSKCSQEGGFDFDDALLDLVDWVNTDSPDLAEIDVKLR